MEKKLFLLDAMALIYRAYFAFGRNPRINSKGLNTSAMLGFTNTLREILKNQKPTHIAVVFDTKVKTHRHIEFPSYKAHREAMPDDLSASLPYIDKILEAFNVVKLYADGYEADDVIGTLAKKAEQEGFTTYMMTPDKDFGQLVSESTFMYRPGRGGNPAEIWGIPEIQKRFSVERPEQVIDILGLWGDAADNIPGIPGIGEKRAKEFIGKYGSVEGLIAHTDELKGKMKENVINFAQQGLDSKRLATIVLDAPVDFDPDNWIIKKPILKKITPLFEELEFRTLLKRIQKENGIEIVQEAPKAVATEGTLDMFAQLDQQEPGTSGVTTLTELNKENTKYTILKDEKSISALIDKIKTKKKLAIDLITNSENPHEAILVAMIFSIDKNISHYISIPKEYDDGEAFLKKFSEIFNSKNIELLGFNLKYILSVLKQYKIEVSNPLFDIMLAHYLIAPDKKHDLTILSEDILEYKILDSDSLLGRKSEAAKRLKKSKVNFDEVKEDLLCEYAGQRADMVLQLEPILNAQLQETDTIKLFQEVEIPLLRVLASVETEGIRLDTETLAKYSIILGKRIEELEKNIHKDAGHNFNISSPKQLGVVLFEELKIAEKPKMTKTKQYKTGEEILVKYKAKHSIVANILEFRTLNKLKSTYVDSLPKLVNKTTNHIHTTYNQAVAATGRLSSNNPNLQNIPIRSIEGKEIRKAFTARNEKFILLAADYSQVELRIIAHLSRDANMLNDFNSGKDVHRATAARVFGVSEEEVDSDMRRNAKGVNFGIIYGISAFGLAENIGVSRTEAKQMIEQYFEHYPGIKLFMEEKKEFAREHGYVETILKRRRYLPDINSNSGMLRAFAERNAINAPIQGSSADMIKVAMINVFAEMQKREMKSKMILQVHDELIFDCAKDEVEELDKLVRTEMENALPLDVPLIVDSNTGANWLDAH
ncbi:MAG: DNA polymerase I [Bacteroidales bacterium]|nr:DNA polymerase I [Bacteroidales bacterium]